MSQKYQESFEFGEFRLDSVQRMLRRGDQEILLAPKVLETLLVLLESGGSIVDKDDLLERIWPDTFVEEGSIARNISILRKALGESPDDQKFIQTIPKRGYRFVAPVRAMAGSDPVLVIEERSRTEASFEVETEEDGPSVPSTKLLPETTPARQWRNAFLISAFAAGVLLVVSGIFALSGSRAAERKRSTARVSVPLPPGLTAVSSPQISPDGTLLVFLGRDASGTDMLWIRALDSMQVQPLPGTSKGGAPFWSPDSRFLAFFSGGKLKKIELSTRAIEEIADAASGRGGAWNREGIILFAPSTNSGLYRVAASGGVVTPVTTLNAGRNETGHRSPQFHPDGRHFAFFNLNQGIYVGSLDSTETKRLLPVRSTAAFAPSGELLFVRNETLMAQPFDTERMQLVGEEVPIAEQVAWQPPYGVADFSVSDTGVLAYQAGGSQKSQLTWVDRHGTKVGTVGDPGYYGSVALSRDGKRVAVDRLEPETATFDLWQFDAARNISTRLTSDPATENLPVWSPDGAAVAFSSDRSGKPDIYIKSLENGEETLVGNAPGRNFPQDWSSDGKSLLYLNIERQTADGWVLNLFGGQRPRNLLHTSFWQDRLALSPDGRWLAYVADDSGQFELYVQPFKGSGQRVRVSQSGSGQARWRGDGKEIFYLALDGTMMVAPVKSEREGDLQIDIPHLLFRTEITTIDTAPQFDVTGDGQRFLLLAPLPREVASQFTLVLNWTAGLKRQ